ncbi:MAG: hypothetical protein M3O30_05235 [Planctomycetota bacterium]|nr:hypothetical protein [Planctomycetota bacterium]
MRNEEINQNERRNSQRWPCAKGILWRIHGGHRVRHGWIPERSMDGIVIAAATEDAAPVGTCILPTDDRGSLRHGFRQGVICRIADLDAGWNLLFVEILA